MNASKALLSLISATSRHDLDGMEKALAQEADPNGLSGSGTTALGMLARENTRDTTQGAMAMLIQHGANIDQVDSMQRTALAWAARAGQPGNLQILLAMGADPWVCDHNGMAALDWAVDAWEVECIKHLIYHAGPSEDPTIETYKGWARAHMDPSQAPRQQRAIEEAIVEWRARRLDQGTVAGLAQRRKARL